MKLSEQFALELKRKMRADPDMAVELENASDLRHWVSEHVRAQTDSDDMSRVVKAFLRTHLSTEAVMRHMAKG